MINDNVVNTGFATSLSPGATLSNERKKQNLTEREVADRLKITLSKLRDIEKDNYNSFPAQIYLRGYLKNYARLLNISEQLVIESYEANAGNLIKEESYTPPQDNTAEPQSRKGLFVLIAACVAAILLALLFAQLTKTPAGSDDAASMFEQATEEPVDSSLDNIEIEQTPLTVETLPSIIDEAEPAINAQGEDGVMATDTDVIEVSSEAVELLASKVTAVELINLSNPELEAPAPQAEVVSLVDVLDFRFIAQCWIEVRDSAGSLLYSGLENAGSQRLIEGDAPFQVVIGNVDGAELSINGETVALQAPVNGRALRMQVGS